MMLRTGKHTRLGGMFRPFGVYTSQLILLNNAKYHYLPGAYTAYAVTHATYHNIAVPAS